MPNHLINENSPYLLQHSENPVDWYAWGPEALEKARREDKPIFLSIGYAACHWCHVMAHESFEDPETATLMNEYFVNIKVDREERPDLDSIYMSAVTALTGSGGWPMSVFLTPDGRPFYGGTYFPSQRHYNLPSFQEVLQTIGRLWREDRQKVLASSEEVARHISAAQELPLSGSRIDPSVVDQSSFQLAQSYDWTDGGWGRAPKFPQPMAIEFLLMRASQGDRMALDVARHALDAMSKGGMYDVVGGGFARYSTDDEWLVPHFEKMLYDNAQLARVYLHAYLLTRETTYRQVCERTLDFIAHEMRSAESRGGFYSSFDADSEGEEGKFYLWTLDEVRFVLKQAQQQAGNTAGVVQVDWAQFFIDAYGVTAQGNFEGKTVLQRRVSDDELAKRYGVLREQVSELLEQTHKSLYEVRSKRLWPGIDDKVLAGWNALALLAFAEAARYLHRPDYLQIAQDNAAFLLTELAPAGKLHRSWRKGIPRHTAYLEDHAGLALSLLSLYQSDPDPRWYTAAVHLAEEIRTHFTDPAGGFFDTSDEGETFILRPKDMQDNATPSGNALAALLLLQLSEVTVSGEWRNQAEQMLAGIQEVAQKYPTAFSEWLCAIYSAVHPIQEIAILGAPDSPQCQALVSVLWEQFRPFSLAAISDHPPPAGSPPLLDDRLLLEGRPTAYICRDFTCLKPVTDPDDMREQLRL